MSQLTTSKTVPADLHAQSPSAWIPTKRGGLATAHLSFSRPISPTLMTRIKSSASASANLNLQADTLRRERMDELLAGLAARRRMRAPLHRRASLPQPSTSASLASPLALPPDPSDWTPPQLARHLASILGLVSHALVADVREWVCREGLDGIRFMSLSDQDLVRMGLSTGWTRTMIEGRDSLRWRTGWEKRNHKSRVISSRRTVTPIGAFSFTTTSDHSGRPSKPPGSAPVTTCSNTTADNPIAILSVEDRLRKEHYHHPESPDPTRWAELGSFLIWATLGLTIITGKVIATKFMLMIRSKT